MKIPLIEQLENIKGLNIKTGLTNTGNLEETYFEILRMFCTDFDQQIVSLREAFDRRDWQDFSVQIRGLKEVFAVIGAEEVRDHAYNLELASKHNDEEYCQKTAPAVIESMIAFRDTLAGTSLMEKTPAASPESSPRGGGEKVVLAVDDMKTSLVTVKNILQNKFTVLLAESAEAADEILKTTKADIILLDIVMPGMSGFDYLKKLREDPEKGKIPVIFVTGHVDSDFIGKALASGVDGYVVKPFVPDALISRIETTLGIT
jgi:CheY-like chemotaxis protein/HPt (histidine-containing phosphotransfer) domain-containing protein